MSAELQPALQVTTPHGALDGHILLIFGIMVVMGILGGVANFYLADRHGDAGRRDWAKYPVFGVVAALTVPLFLNMISSTLLEGESVSWGRWQQQSIPPQQAVAIVDSYSASLETLQSMAAGFVRVMYLDDTERLDYPEGMVVHASPGPHGDKSGAAILPGASGRSREIGRAHV